MDDSFKLRVNKIFGCLASSSSAPASSPSSASLWCLTDDDIERREWNRDKAIPEPQPPTRSGLLPACFDGRRNRPRINSIDCEGELLNDLAELDDDDLEDEPRLSGSSLKSTKPDDYGEEEWEIKSSIGLDCTLDFEEEEDEYDKVAVGKEKAVDCLFLKDVTEYEINIDSSSILPNSANHFIRDPRANHLAAKLRLKEDSEATEKLDSLQVYHDNGSPTGAKAVESNSSEIPKSILKRKDEQFISRPLKRVRFDPECKSCTSDEDPEESKDAAMEILSIGSEAVSDQAHLPQVPDYIRHPLRYTHYTFDSANDVDEESNKAAYLDFLAFVKKPQASELQQEDASNLPKGLTFIPRKKTGDAVKIENITQNQGGSGKEPVQQRSIPVSIAAEKAENNDEVCDMDEDEVENSDGRRNSSHKVGRQYRTRTKIDQND